MTKRIATVAVLGLSMTAIVAGCGRLASLSDHVLASVGDEKLYRSDLAGITSQATSATDSVRIAGNYVKEWIHTQVKLQAAAAMWPKNDKEIDALVEDYRNSLLEYKLDQYYVNRNLDTLITDEMVQAYFEEHRSQFVLDRTVVEGRIVRVPSSYRQAASLLALMRSGDAEKQQDFMDICRKNNLELHEFGSWVDFDEFLSYLPVRSNRNNEYDYMLDDNNINTLSDAGNKYYYQITSYLKEGSYAPFENADEAVRKIIYNQRRGEVIQAYGDSLYNEGMRNKKITINVNIDE